MSGYTTITTLKVERGETFYRRRMITWLVDISWEERQEKIKDARARIAKAEAKREAKRQAKRDDAKADAKREAKKNGRRS